MLELLVLTSCSPPGVDHAASMLTCHSSLWGCAAFNRYEPVQLIARS